MLAKNCLTCGAALPTSLLCSYCNTKHEQEGARVRIVNRVVATNGGVAVGGSVHGSIIVQGGNVTDSTQHINATLCVMRYTGLKAREITFLQGCEANVPGVCEVIRRHDGIEIKVNGVSVHVCTNVAEVDNWLCTIYGR
jgi:hypothetical protein